MGYDKRFVVAFLSGSEEQQEIIRAGKDQIARKNSDTVSFFSTKLTSTSLQDSTDESLLTLIGHGGAGKVGDLGSLQMAQTLHGAGLRKCKMITLIACSGAADEFASGLVSSLALHNNMNPVRVNARKGYVTLEDGKQWVQVGETGFYRQKTGTKILYQWDGTQVTETTAFEGYTDEGIKLVDVTATPRQEIPPAKPRTARKKSL
jgi:transcription initiation factor TFIID subunit TAF12